jgi:hypothetical protein
MSARGCCASPSSGLRDGARVSNHPFPDQAIAVRAIIEQHDGRWVVLLQVTMIPDRDDYIVTHRIADYPTQRHAEIAARWIVGAASRDLPRPPLAL